MIERKMLSLETTALLDKLYNLRGEESIILVEMDKQKDIAEETKERTTNEKKELQDKISNLETENSELNSQGEKLKTLLQGIDRSEFGTVLDRLEMDFEPDKLIEKLTNLLPETIKKIENDITEANNKLTNVEEEMAAALTTIDEISIRRDAAYANQIRLNEYFDMSLNGNINITRDQITDLLAELNLSEDEAREGAKLLMFPEDALFEYDRRSKEDTKAGKSISEVFKEATMEPQLTVEEDIKPNTELIANPVVTEDDNFMVIDLDDDEEVSEIDETPVIILDDEVEVPEPITLDETMEISIEPTIEEPVISFDDEVTDLEKNITAELEAVDTRKDQVIAVLASNGIDYLDIDADDMNNVVNNFNKEVLENNIAIVKKHGIDTDMLIDNASLLNDSELGDKINLLIASGKESLDIYFNAKVLVKYDYKGLEDAINGLKENGLDPKKVPLMAY